MLSGTRRCAVLGTPIEHSLSPALHRAAYAELGLDWRYDAIEVDEAGLAGFLDGLDARWRGLSLTMPLKRAVIPLLDEVDPWSRIAGAANTVILGDGRRRGYNTDIPGARAAIVERLGTVPASVVVLGGGATAASVALALADVGTARVEFWVRDQSRVGETVAVLPDGIEVTVRGLDDSTPSRADLVDLVVSTIPAAAQTPELCARLDQVGAVFEVRYDPWPTPLAAQARGAGRRLISGLDLLAHQAVAQVRLMTGADIGVELLRAAGEAELSGRLSGRLSGPGGGVEDHSAPPA